MFSRSIESRSDDGFDLRLRVAGSPSGHVEVGGRVREGVSGDGISSEQIWQNDEVAGFGEGVGEETVVDELEAEDVGEVEDC